MEKFEKLLETMNKHSQILDALYKNESITIDEVTARELLEFDLIYFKEGKIQLCESTRNFFARFVK